MPRVPSGHAGSLAADRLRNAAVAVAQAGNGGAARRVDDALAIGLDQVDAFTLHRHGWHGAGTVQNAAFGHWYRSLLRHEMGNAWRHVLREQAQ